MGGVQRGQDALDLMRAGADLVAIDNAGHMAPIEQPDAVAAAITIWMRRL